MLATQLAFFPEINEKEILSEVIEILVDYKSLKVKMLNRQEVLERGYSGNLFPIFKNNDLESELKVNLIERALNFSLDKTERLIIEMKYLNSEEKTDLNIYLDLGIKKKLYYIKKKRALLAIAKSLGMI
ncbi:ArpU family phage packaging/lysis transcriptional regulator [Bacillus sp. CGMCC 1.16607]|uniref:ArpU family phage packaging/lysis transcriptional regulator n=1 Tax=Bacillus sp. CGMCC 1.16607 TaxID=3351842 RepID=UPI00363F92C5